jgi:hypothetical protein
MQGKPLTSGPTSSFNAGGNVSVLQGNLALSSTTANYIIAGNLTVAPGSSLIHSQDWNATGTQIILYGNLNIQGSYDYSPVGRAHIGMYGTGNITISAPNTELSILTLNNGVFSATGNFTINDNFWAMFGSTGSFSTNGQVVTAKAGVLVNGGTVNINGGALNVTSGLQIGVAGLNGAVSLSSGTLNTDLVNIGDGTLSGTLTQSGGTANIGSLNIFSTAGNAYTCSGSPLINVSGNWTNNRAATAFIPANSTVTFNGTTAQSIGGTFTTAFYNLALNNSGGIVSFGSAYTISNNLSIATGSVANLGSFTHAVPTLTLGSAGRAAGTWGHPLSTATYINNVYFAANTGLVNVSAGTCTAPAFSILVANVSCHAGNNGSIKVTVSGGVADYEFSKDGGTTWSAPQSENEYTFSNLAVSGNPYTIAVRDGSGCIQTNCE